ncbi:glycosyl transferase, family 39 [Desulfosarcina variabilis str. Montpellier]|uniref:ArnT family glycosyltransferase n=1 Tax=Desulfosarcina variabilis TaxID=2300 RepID=UPI003AFABB2A
MNQGTVKINSGVFIQVVLILILTGLITCILVMSTVPPVSRDALTHHLAVPKLWIKAGGIIEMPDIVFSYYPMNIDLLYALPLLFGNDIIPKYIHFAFALGTSWMIYLYLAKRTTRTLALFGVLLFLSTPIIIALCISAYVDLGLIFFSWGAFYYLLEWRIEPDRIAKLIVSAVFCGLGLGTKYNGLLVFFLLTLFVPIVYIRAQNQRHSQVIKAIAYPILFTIVAMTVFSPWMIRNYRLTDNPVFPLYDRLFKPDNIEANNSSVSLNPWTKRKLIYKESFWDTLAIPIRIFFQGKDDNPKYFDGRLNPILIMLPFLILLRPRNVCPSLKVENALLAIFVVLYILYASFIVDMRIRYISPVLPPLVILCVMGCHAVKEKISAISNNIIKSVVWWSFSGTIAFFLFLNADYLINLYKVIDPIPYLTGKCSRESYLNNKMPDYATITYANRIIDGQMKILAVFMGNRRYYFEKDVVFGISSFQETVINAPANSRLGKILINNHYTHLMIGITLFEKWANGIFNDDQNRKIAQLVHEDCRLLFTKNGYALFQITP